MSDKDIEQLSQPAESADKVAEAAGELEVKLERAVDDRLEERFAWILVVIILFDAAIFHDAETWSGPIVVGLFQFILVVVLARKYQVQEIPQILAKLLDRAADYTNKPRG